MKKLLTEGNTRSQDKTDSSKPKNWPKLLPNKLNLFKWVLHNPGGTQ